MTTTPMADKPDPATLPAAPQAASLLGGRPTDTPLARPAKPAPSDGESNSVEYWYLCGDGATMR